jgi:hypothetical protein
MGRLQRFGAAARRSKDLVGPENATEPTDGDTTQGNSHHDDKRYPSPLENAEH